MKAILTTLALIAIFVCGCGAPSGPLRSCPDAGTTLTYETFGAGFMTHYCLACHSGARVEKRVDLSTAANVRTHAESVISTAGAGTSMPPSGPMPSTEERAQLAEWVSCGAP